MQGNKSKLQSFFKPPTPLHWTASPLHERDWSMGGKEWHSFGACCCYHSKYSEVSWLLSFSMVTHWPYIICDVEVDRDVGGFVGFRPECDVCVHVLLFTGLHLSPRPPHQERRGE